MRPGKDVYWIEHVIVFVKENAVAPIDFKTSKCPVHAENILGPKEAENQGGYEKKHGGKEFALHPLPGLGVVVWQRGSFLGGDVVGSHKWGA